MRSLIKNSKPDFKRVVFFAYQTLQKHHIVEFPIDILPMILNHNDLELITYQDMAKRLTVPLSDIIEMCGSKDGSLGYNENKQKYMILYNDDLSIPEVRIRFTLSHEYGHYLLKHIHKTDSDIILRHSVSESENEIFEQEANLFARELLAPVFLVNLIEPLDVNFISDYFYVSEQVSESLIKQIVRSYENGWTDHLQTPYYLKGQFKQLKL